MSIKPLGHSEGRQGSAAKAPPAAKFNPKRHASTMADILWINPIMGNHLPLSFDP
jgi:hypothetical protein